MKYICLSLLMCLYQIASATDVQVYPRDFTSGSPAYRNVTATLTGLSGQAVAGPWVLVGDSVTLNTGTNGMVTFSNMLAVGEYRLDVAGNPSRSFPFSLSVTSGVYNVTQLIGTNNSVEMFYDSGQVDALMSQQGMNNSNYVNQAVTNSVISQLTKSNNYNGTFTGISTGQLFSVSITNIGNIQTTTENVTGAIYGNLVGNASTATNAVNSTNFWGVLSPTNLPAGLSGYLFTNSSLYGFTTNRSWMDSTSNGMYWTGSSVFPPATGYTNALEPGPYAGVGLRWTGVSSLTNQSSANMQESNFLWYADGNAFVFPQGYNSESEVFITGGIWDIGQITNQGALYLSNSGPALHMMVSQSQIVWDADNASKMASISGGGVGLSDASSSVTAVFKGGKGYFDGSQVTNVNASTAVYATNFVGVLSPTNLPAGLSSSNYVGNFIGNSTGATNSQFAGIATNAITATNAVFASTATNAITATNAVFASTATNAITATNAVFASTATNGASSGFFSTSVTNSGNIQTSTLTASNIVSTSFIGSASSSTNAQFSGVATNGASSGFFTTGSTNTGWLDTAHIHAGTLSVDGVASAQYFASTTNPISFFDELALTGIGIQGGWDGIYWGSMNNNTGTNVNGLIYTVHSAANNLSVPMYIYAGSNVNYTVTGTGSKSANPVAIMDGTIYGNLGGGSNLPTSGIWTNGGLEGQVPRWAGGSVVWSNGAFSTTSSTATNGASSGFFSTSVTNSGNIQTSTENVTGTLTASSLAGPLTGNASTATFATSAATATNGASSGFFSTSVTNSGNIQTSTENVTGTLTASSLASMSSLLVTNGITNQSLTANGLVYSDSGGQMRSVTAGGASQYLKAGTPPGFATINGATDISGTVPLAALSTAANGLTSGSLGTNNVLWTDQYQTNGLFVTGKFITVSNSSGTTVFGGANSTNSGSVTATSFLGFSGQVTIGGSQQLPAGYAVTSAGATLVANSGFQGGEIIQPVVQMSGTAASSALQVNPSIISTGSGLNDIAELLNSGTLKVNFDLNGNQTNVGGIKASAFYGPLHGNADTATLITNAIHATIATNLVAWPNITNANIYIMTVNGQAGFFIVYPDTHTSAISLQTNGQFSVNDVAGNSVFYYSGLPAGFDSVQISRGGLPAFFTSASTGTVLYDQYGDQLLTVNSNSVTVATNFVVTGTINSRLPVVSKTANYAVTSGDSGTYFNNNGAVSAMTNTLPASAVGLTYNFAVLANQTLCIKATAPDIIRSGATVSAAGGTIFSSTTGGTLHLYCPATGGWWIDSTNGSWTGPQ